VEDLHDSDDNLNDIDDLDAEPGWILARNRCSVALIGDSYHVRTPTIYAAGSYVILELSSSLNLVPCTLYVGRVDARMPMFVTAFLQEQWRHGTAKTY